MNGYLVLESGEIYQGKHNGVQDRAGEVVFNTSHSGYEEIATDPSYYSQIVVMTAPMQGNYGINKKVWESRRLWIEGFVSLQIQNTPRDHAWADLLKNNQIPTLCELDTREIVMRLRDGGTPWGAIVSAQSEEEAKTKAKALISEKKKIDNDWVYAVSRTGETVLEGNNPNGPRLAVIDFGSKENILRELLQYCSELKIFNSRASAGDILRYMPDGIMLTNGPGDPSEVKVARETIQVLVGNKPVFGICMGHQVLALALGAETYKLKFGHRGSNHPIQDKLLNVIYMTSQNHGYAVKKESLPIDCEVTQINLNDQTVAGFYSKKRNCLGIQYHPESHPGPHEASKLFKYYIEKMVQK